MLSLGDEVEHLLGHVVTKNGLKPNNRNLDAVRSFPPPTNFQTAEQNLSGRFVVVDNVRNQLLLLGRDWLRRVRLHKAF